MRRDSLFYQLFQQYPQLLFDLLNHPPDNAADYRFDSVAVKEPRFEIDGVFLPPDTDTPGILYFCEVQFQKDERFYERVFAEALLYFYRNRERLGDWQIVIIYPNRRIEQSNTYPYRCLLASDQIHRMYLNELGNIRQLPVPLALLSLTTLDSAQAREEARYLLARVEPNTPQFSSRTLVELVTTIMMYRYDQLSQKEVQEMLGIKTLKETRVYQEAKAEGEQAVIFRLLTRLFGELPKVERDRIEALPLPSLEDLSEALLDFESLDDLQSWLNAVPATSSDNSQA